MIALTSLSPDPLRLDAQREAISSWRKCGLYVQAMQRSREIGKIRELYDVEIIPDDSPSGVFGDLCVGVNGLVSYSRLASGQVLLLNSDIILQLTSEQLDRFAAACSGGLGYLIKHHFNANGTLGGGCIREPYGIDAFLFDARDIELKSSFLSMGQPVWDYWIPFEYMRRRLCLYTMHGIVALHRRHNQTWDIDRWDACGVEFCRMYPHLDGAYTLEGRMKLFQNIHRTIVETSKVVEL